MTAELVNIAAEGKNPLFIDAASVTSVMLNAEKKELAVDNEKGQLLWINFESYGVDPDKLLERLAAAGNKLVPFPVRNDDGSRESAYFVSPAAVTFATVTEVTKKGTLGAIVGIKGHGRLESTGTKPEELQTLLDAVKAEGKEMIEFKPGVANARWYNPAALYIDPAAVNTIRDDGSQVNVYFDASGSLDVQTKTYSTEEQAANNKRENEMLNRFWKERRADFKDLNDVYNEVKRIMESEEAQKRAFIAETIAAANGTLKKVESAKYPTYVHPEDYAYVTFYDDDRKDTTSDFRYSMSFHPQKTQANPYPDEVRAYFNSAAARAKSFEGLTGLKAPAPAAKKADAGPTP